MVTLCLYVQTKVVKEMLHGKCYTIAIKKKNITLRFIHSVVVGGSNMQKCQFDILLQKFSMLKIATTQKPYKMFLCDCIGGVGDEQMFLFNVNSYIAPVMKHFLYCLILILTFILTCRNVGFKDPESIIINVCKRSIKYEI